MAVSEGRGDDRLSTLPDDILIAIISYLPLLSAVDTGSLSRRWRNLWTNTTSVDVSWFRSGGNTSKFRSVLCNIMMQLKSQFIHSFRLNLDWYIPDDYYPDYSTDYSWIQQICYRNVRELKLTWTYFKGHEPILPYYIFQIHSLVSLKLVLTFDWASWEFLNDGDSIILPNLKKLSLCLHGSQHKSIEKLIKACSLLEDFSLTLKDRKMSCDIMNYCHPNLRRLSLILDINYKTKVVINSPKLNYLNVCGRYDTIFYFEEEPVALQEAKIELDDHHYTQYLDGKSLMIKFCETISNARFLTLDVFALQYISNVFRNATRLTIDMRNCYDIERVSSLLERCPVLDVLTMKFGNVFWNLMWDLIPPKHCYVSTSRHVVKRIDIEFFLPEHAKPFKPFLALLEYLLLSSPVVSEQFNFRLTGDKYCEMECVERKKGMELDLCEVFEMLPLVMIQGEIEFVGEYCKLSRIAGPEVRGASRKVINFSCSSS